MRRRGHLAAALGVGLCALLAACGGSDGIAPAAAHPSTAPTPTASATATTAFPVPTGPNHVPPGALSPTQVHELIAYFDDRVAKAYADGSTDGLDQILAGPELRGTAGTLGVLVSQHRRNIFTVVVDAVTIQSSSPERVVAMVNDHTTVDTFVDASTGVTLNQGLPGPEVRTFLVFIDYNPTTQAWYWTGAQKENPSS